MPGQREMCPTEVWFVLRGAWDTTFMVFMAIWIRLCAHSPGCAPPGRVTNPFYLRLSSPSTGYYHILDPIVRLECETPHTQQSFGSNFL
jgi:hypothetical protein